MMRPRLLACLLLAVPLAAGAATAPGGSIDLMATAISEAFPRLGPHPVLLFPAAPRVPAEASSAIEGALLTRGAVLLPGARLDRLLTQHRLSPDDLADPRVALLLAEIAGADAMLHATVPPESERPELILRLLRVPDGELLAEASMPLGSEPCLSREGLLRANASGVVRPECTSCPPAPWPAGQGIPAGEAGTKLMVDFIVTVEGRACDVRLRKPRHPALDQAILRQVRSYRFKPAMRNGEAIPVIWWLWVGFSR